LGSNYAANKLLGLASRVAFAVEMPDRSDELQGSLLAADD
jgi:hypothetical protein